MNTLNFCLLVVTTTSLLGCSTSQPNAEPFTAREFVQSGSNRWINIGMRDNLEGLKRVLDTLYKRNPKEWPKSGEATREAAINRIWKALETGKPLPEFEGATTEMMDGKAVRANIGEVAAIRLAFEPTFSGDRAGTFIYGVATMLITAHGGNTTLDILNGVSAQSAFNAARNVELASWLLTSRKNPNSTTGGPMLLSNEISTQARNLSIEREIGKIVGRLDLEAVIMDEKYRRAGIDYLQSFIGGNLLQFLPIK